MSVKFDKGTALSSLSLMPLIDVVFLLLIFFLVATRFAEEEREMAIVLPSASEAKPLSAKPKEIFVNIDKDGRYVVQHKVVDLGQLEAVLVRASINNPNQIAIGAFLCSSTALAIAVAEGMIWQIAQLAAPTAVLWRNGIPRDCAGYARLRRQQLLRQP